MDFQFLTGLDGPSSVVSRAFSELNLRQQVNAVFSSLVSDNVPEFNAYLDEVAGSEADQLLVATREFAETRTLGQAGLALGIAWRSCDLS